MKKLCIVVANDTLENAMMSLIIASTAAAMGVETHIFYTFWGLNLLKKGGLEKAKLGKMSLFTGMMKSRMKAKNIPGPEELLKAAVATGNVHLHACSTTAELMNIKKEDMIPEVEDVIGAATFLELAKDGQIIFLT
ncbi:MAG: DsrE/DsrF/DrsH-like family protein [Thermofilum sp.]